MRKAPQEPSQLVKALYGSNVIGIEATYDHDGVGLKSWVTFTVQFCEGAYMEMPTATMQIKGEDLHEIATFNTDSWPVSLIVLTDYYSNMCHEWYAWVEENEEKLEQYNELKAELGL